MGASWGAYELNHSRAPERVTIFYYRDKTQVQMI